MKNLITLLFATTLTLVGYSQTVYLDTTVQLWATGSTYQNIYEETVTQPNTIVYVKWYTVSGTPTGDNTLYIDGVVYGTPLTNNILQAMCSVGSCWVDTLTLQAGQVLRTEVSNGGKMMVDYTFTHQSTVSVDEYTYNHKVVLYPNPVVNFINLEFETNTNNVEYMVYDMSGRLVLNGTYYDRIDVTSLTRGTFILQLNIDGKVKTEKFIK